MRARGDFGHHAAIGPVRRFLPREAVRDDRAVAAHERRGGFVARGFEAQDQHRLSLSRSEEHTSELQSLMRISYAVSCLKKKNRTKHHIIIKNTLLQLQLDST